MTLCVIDGTEYLGVDETQALLGDLQPDLHDAVRGAWKHWRSQQPGLLTRPTNRTRATVMHDLMVDQVRRRLADHERVQIFDEQHGRRFLLAIRGETGNQGALLQLKKLNSQNTVSNFPTPSSVAFNGQQPLLGVPVGTRLTLGYKLIDLDTDIAVKIVFFDGRRVVWHYDLDGGARVEQLELPAAPDARRVRAKPGVLPQRGLDEAEND